MIELFKSDLCFHVKKELHRGYRYKVQTAADCWHGTLKGWAQREVLTLLMSSGLCTVISVRPGTYSCPLPSGFILMSSLSVGFSPSRFLTNNTNVYNLSNLS